ncbi:MAG: D-alanyl-D-alanine endopeptidase [Burkholderiales bacterium PBB5]|nr:MAG: D-alanyl-D-alanine endopeptidase [Burkholderiales bacterium PBB5]
MTMKLPLKAALAVLCMSVVLVAPAVAADASPAKHKAGLRKPAATAQKSGKAVKASNARVVNTRRVALAAAAMPMKASFGQAQGLHANADALALKSSVALVVDQDTNEVLFSKNSNAVLPIASITKLMTGLVIAEAKLPLDEVLTITQDDVDTEKGSRSRLKVGTQLTRGEMMHLALMSSENRAANALGRHYPGGLSAFVTAMNHKASTLGMADTHYVEPTGLNSKNQSSAHDLAVLVKEAYGQPLLRDLSTSQEAQVQVGGRTMNFHTTNGLVRSPNWDIGLQKTGYISEAGRCLVMQAQLAGRRLVMVLLDSAGKYSRIGDAERIRKWLGQATAEGVRPNGRRAG